MRALTPSDPSRVGRYELEGRLGAGGMGTVYLGRSPGGRPAAIKVLKGDDQSHPEARIRFRREAEILRTVRNAFTAALIDCELEQPPFWLATEYIPGPTLAKTITQDGALPPEQCFRLMAALAEGLADIHAHGICHRDLKPQNVIMSPTGPQLIDFGIARELAPTGLTQTGIAMGTAGYTSPEQFEGHELTPAADIFGLGATIANAATGRRPYGTGSVDNVTFRLMNEDVDLDGVDERLAALLRECLARDPARRPSSDAIVARCLAERGPVAAAANATAKANAPAPAAGPAHAAPPRSRKRLLVVAGAVLAALVLFGGGAFAAMRLGRSDPAGLAADPAGPAGATSPSPSFASPFSAAVPFSPSASASAASASPPPRASATRGSARPSASRPAAPPAPAVTTVTSGDNRCIELPADQSNGIKVFAAACDGSAAQRWAFSRDGVIMNGTRCLDIGGNAGADIGYRIQLWDCNLGKAQVWLPQPGGTLLNERSGRCLSILGDDQGGPALAIAACTGTAAQQWKLPPA
jgi:hypothetical protein